MIKSIKQNGFACSFRTIKNAIDRNRQFHKSTKKKNEKY